MPRQAAPGLPPMPTVVLFDCQRTVVNAGRRMAPRYELTLASGRSEAESAVKTAESGKSWVKIVFRNDTIGILPVCRRYRC